VLHSVLIVDDTEFMRFVLREIMSELPIGMIAEAGGVEEAVDLAEALGPDLAVVDFTDPDLDAGSVIAELRSVQPGLRVVAIVPCDDAPAAAAAQACGALALVEKPFDPEAVAAVLRPLVEGVPVG